MLSRRQFLLGAAATVAVPVGLGLYTCGVEPFWVDVVQRPLPIGNLPPHLEGARLVQLSDIHVGPLVPDSYVVNAFARVAEARPDIVVITGDLTQAATPDQVDAVYSRVPRGRLGTVAVLGNHDYGRNWSQPEVAEELVGILSSHGVTTLRNEVGDVAGLKVVGMDDVWAGRFRPSDALSGVKAGAPTLCLSHNPDTVDMDGWGDTSCWVLSGHTHGGQVRPPFLEPPRLPVKNKRYTSGAFKVSGGRGLYINRGLGFLKQVRFNARPEITLFELHGA